VAQREESTDPGWSTGSLLGGAALLLLVGAAVVHGRRRGAARG
jgi:hypothetical protein